VWEVLFLDKEIIFHNNIFIFVEMLKAIIITAFLGIFSASIIKGQELPVHEQYMFDYMLVNPSFAGLSEVTSIKMIHRQQWVGIDDAPNTSFLLFKRRLKDRTGGIGGYMYSDHNGPNSKFGAQFSWSFQALLKNIRFKRQVLSFGMSFRASLHVLDESSFERDIYDSIINYSRKTTFLPNANAGAMYSYNQSFVGVSFDNLIPWTDRMYNISIEPINYVHMNIHTGHIIHLLKKLQIRPSAMFKTNFHGLNQFDFNVKFHLLGGKEINSVYLRYPSEVWVGMSYRQTLDWQNSSALSVSPAIGFSVKAFTFMYLYDLGLTTLQMYHGGTHQICVGIRLYPDQYINWGKFYVPLFADDF
jgi:type IX secretion system PorP/SprF family membrane protein